MNELVYMEKVYEMSPCRHDITIAIFQSEQLFLHEVSFYETDPVNNQLLICKELLGPLLLNYFFLLAVDS